MPSAVHATRRSRSAAGFTISEFLVVMAVLGLLIGIVITSVNGINGESDERDCRTELRTTFAGQARDVAAADYVPKMNVTPNAVATKD